MRSEPIYTRELGTHETDANSIIAILLAFADDNIACQGPVAACPDPQACGGAEE
jgi:hypothetical protein